MKEEYPLIGCTTLRLLCKRKLERVFYLICNRTRIILLVLFIVVPAATLSSSGMERSLLERVDYYFVREVHTQPSWEESVRFLEFWVTCYSTLPKDVDRVALYKSLILQESGFNPMAISRVGARGLGQFMPNTWDWVSMRLWGHNKDVHSIEYNIQATVYYFEWLYLQWSSERPELDRVALTLASYNAGLGNILKAQQLAGGSVYYQDIENELHKVTGKHSKETKEYVARVLANYKFYTSQE